MAAIGLAQAIAAGELIVAHVGPFTSPLAGNGLAKHEGTRASVEEATQPAAWTRATPNRTAATIWTDGVSGTGDGFPRGGPTIA